MKTNATAVPAIDSIYFGVSMTKKCHFLIVGSGGCFLGNIAEGGLPALTDLLAYRLRFDPSECLSRALVKKGG